MKNIRITAMPENYRESIRQMAWITAGKKYTEEPVPDNVFLRYIIQEHTPIRGVSFRIEMEGIPYYSSTHFARHVHTMHFVQSGRPDITGKPRSVHDTVTHQMVANIQGLIDMMRKRLCSGNVSLETFKIAVGIKRSFLEFDRCISLALVPNCVYRYGCPEGSRGCRWFAGHESKAPKDIGERMEWYSRKLFDIPLG